LRWSATPGATCRQYLAHLLQGRLAGYDNLFYQYRQGYIDESFYQSRIVSSIKKMAPFWIEFGLPAGVTLEFRAEVERIISGG